MINSSNLSGDERNLVDLFYLAKPAQFHRFDVGHKRILSVNENLWFLEVIIYNR